MLRKRIKSKPGLFGTVCYYDENGNPIGKSRPGLMEGTRVYTDQNGKYAGKIRPGILAKKVFTDTEGNRITSYHRFRGETHFKNGKPIGHSRPGLFGTSYTTLEIPEYTCEEEQASGTNNSKMETQNNEYTNGSHEGYTPQRTAYTFVKILQFIFLFLVICTISICIYAMLKLL